MQWHVTILLEISCPLAAIPLYEQMAIRMQIRNEPPCLCYNWHRTVYLNTPVVVISVIYCSTSTVKLDMI
jgi:hypothetical protein